MIGAIPGAPPVLDLNLGGWAGRRWPFNEDAADVVISGATTWSDAIGYKRVRKLTIDAGQTLTIKASPFWIFADEIVFGGTDSIINGNGPDGASSGTFDAAYARGGTYVSGGRAQGGCGGIMLFVVCRRISGSAGIIRATGGAAYRDTTNATVQGAAGGQGALSQSFDLASGPQTWLGQHEFGTVLGSGAGSQSNHAVNGGGSGAAGTVPNASGGSGIGAGGAASSTATRTTGTAPPVSASPQQLVMLAQAGCLGGGGGGAGVAATGTNNDAGGGGGGSVCVWVYELVVTPTLAAAGGAGAGPNVGGATGGAGLAGITHLINLGG